jgi:hypothetical protein
MVRIIITIASAMASPSNLVRIGIFNPATSVQALTQTTYAQFNSGNTQVYEVARKHVI